MNQKVIPAKKIKGAISAPPDKSISHRAAMFASLHDGESVITNFSSAADPQSTLNCLRSLGVSIARQDSTLTIKGVGREGFSVPRRDLECGNSGTTMRLLSGILAGAGIKSRLTGDASLSSRTMRRIIDPLKQMGASIKARKGDYAPLEIERTLELVPLRFELPIPSAQLKSCLLLAGLFGENPTRIIEPIHSRDHTERLLQLDIKEENGMRVISSSSENQIPRQSYQIPGDFSAAAFWLAAGAIHPEAEIRLRRTGANPSRTAFLDILREMGGHLTIDNERIEGGEPVADITVRSSELKPVNISKTHIPNCIDELPILAITMLFADGISRISGAEELRHKETDRLKTVAGILQNAGADFIESNDGLEIHGRPGFTPKPALFRSCHDHRVAMSAAILALMGKQPAAVEHAECTAISYPSFWNDLEHLTN